MQKKFAIWCASWENVQHCCLLLKQSYLCAKFAVLSAVLNIQVVRDMTSRRLVYGSRGFEEAYCLNLQSI